ncbi:Protein ANTAGONIST OF LIKE HETEROCHROMATIN PROTEIN 1 [Linum perenne]
MVDQFLAQEFLTPRFNSDPITLISRSLLVQFHTLMKLRIHNNALGVSIPSDEEVGLKYFFRVSKNTFEYICSIVREDLISRPPSGLINIEGRLLSVEKQVAISLRRLAFGESQVSVGASFGVGQCHKSPVIRNFSAASVHGFAQLVAISQLER